MAGAPVAEPCFQKCWLLGFRHHFTDRCVRTPDKCRHSIEGVLSMSVLSNTHSVINQVTVRKNYQNVYNTLKTTVCCHTCFRVACIRIYIYRKLIGLPMGKSGIEPLLLVLEMKTLKPRYHELVIMSTKIKWKSTVNCASWARKFFLQDEGK